MTAPCMAMACTQGLNDTLVALLPQWRISGASIVVQRCPEMPDTCEPMALRIVFMQLTALHSEAGVLHLRGWRITPAILKTISQYKGQWKIVFDQCQFNQGPVKDVISTGGLGYLTGLIIPDQPLTDELLTMVLLHCPAITQMSVLEIAIQASYAQCRVRWQTLVWQQGSVGAATISMLPTGLRSYYVTPYPKLAWHYVVMPPSMLTKTQVCAVHRHCESHAFIMVPAWWTWLVLSLVLLACMAMHAGSMEYRRWNLTWPGEYVRARVRPCVCTCVCLCP